MSELLAFDATAQADLVRSGAVKPFELVEAAIDAAEQLDPELSFLVHRRFEAARDEAAGDLPDGPFRGVPFLLKDLECPQAGEPLTAGMGFLQRLGWRPTADSALTGRFRRAGLVVLGRTKSPELGLLPTTEPLAFGPARNPWDRTRSPGGSSGGSAAAVAAGVVPFAHANDGGGSIRIPASACGLVGLKPSRARVSMGPQHGDAFGGLAAEFAVTRSVRDAAALLDAVHGRVSGDPYDVRPPDRPYLAEVGADPGRLRIGVRAGAGGWPLDPACQAAAEQAAALLASLGHHVEVAHPAALDDDAATGDMITTWAAGMAAALDGLAAETGRPIGPEDVEPCTWALAELGRAATAADFLSVRERLHRYARAVQGWWEEDGWDLLLTPTMAEPPTLLGEFAQPADNPLQAVFRAGPLTVNTMAFNVTGQPAVSLPLGWREPGDEPVLPIGVQLVAAFGREDVLVRVAAQLEEAAPWGGRRPPSSAV